MSSDTILAELAREMLVERRRARRWKIALRLLTLALLTTFFVGLAFDRERRSDSRGEALYGADAGGEGHAALVRIEGVIASGEKASLEPVARALARAFADEETRAVVLDIDSPGGSPVQSGLLFDEILRQREAHPGIPVHAVLGDIAASGGYYVAAAAQTVHADGASIVGSIGVRLDSFGAVDAIEKLGIERRLLIAGEYKALLDPFSPVEPVAVERLQAMIDNVHEQFIAAVKRGRGERLADDPQLFTGLVWSGEEALELGLVDALGSVQSVARDVLGVPRVIDFTEEEDLFARFAGPFASSVAGRFDALVAGTVREALGDAMDLDRLR